MSFLGAKLHTAVPNDGGIGFWVVALLSQPKGLPKGLQFFHILPIALEHPMCHAFSAVLFCSGDLQRSMPQVPITSCGTV